MPWSRRRFAGSVIGVAACAADTLPSLEGAPQGPESRGVPSARVPEPRAPAWRAAIGPLDDLPPELRGWLGDPRGHEPPPPRVAAVMRRHGEVSHTVAEYVAAAPNPVTTERHTLVLQPVGSFPFDVVEGDDFVGLVRTPKLEELAAVLGASFGLPVELLPAVPLESFTLVSRRRHRITQFDTGALLRTVATVMPPHAYAMLTLVNVDLFAVPEQHYAFGWSLHRGRQGVASFARFDPSFHGGRRDDDLEQAIARRSVRLLRHECAHMFGLTHCDAFRCVLNPVDVLDDLDALAVHPCPVCQCKLLRGAGVDPVAALGASIGPLERMGLWDDAAWARRRLAEQA